MDPLRQRNVQPATPQPRQVRGTVRSGVQVLIPTEVTSTIQDEVVQNSRRTFWRTYEDWLAKADSQEIDQLESALQPHSQHVRHITLAISDAMRDPTACGLIPISLSAALATAGWHAEPPLTRPLAA